MKFHFYLFEWKISKGKKSFAHIFQVTYTHIYIIILITIHYQTKSLRTFTKIHPNYKIFDSNSNSDCNTLTKRPH